MDSMNSAPRAGRQVCIRGHEVVSHTSAVIEGGYRCLVFLLDPYDKRHDLRIFQGFGDAPAGAEASALAEALVFLEIAGRDPRGAASSRSTVWVGGRWVDIFCDTIGEGLYQAFPFERRADGTRALIMQFHLKEAVTGHTPSTAVSRCVRRLQEYFEGASRAALASEKPLATAAPAQR